MDSGFQTYVEGQWLTLAPKTISLKSHRGIATDGAQH